jgi:hypothetical protein
MLIDIFYKVNLLCDVRKQASFFHLFEAKVGKFLDCWYNFPPIEVKIKELSITKL